MPGETVASKKALVCSWSYFYQPGGHTRGQTLLSSLRQPLNNKFKNAALDNLSPHWSWQYECGHGAKWCFGEWDCTSSLVLLRSRLPAAPVSMGLFHLWHMEFKGSFDVAQFFWLWYSIPNLAQWEWTRNCRVLQELWKNQAQLVSVIFNEEKLQSISSPELVLFSSKSSPCKASTTAGIQHFLLLLESACVIVPVVTLGVHHEHLKWLLLPWQMAPNKEGQRGFCLSSAVARKESTTDCPMKHTELCWPRDFFTRLNQP